MTGRTGEGISATATTAGELALRRRGRTADFARTHLASLGATRIALVLILAAGTALRVWLIHLYRPGFFGYPDAVTYVAAASRISSAQLFINPYRPAGYPIFLALLHGLDARATLAIAAQHLMGLLTALLLYLTAARFTRRRSVALLPAAVVTFSGTQLYLEHSALSEALYTLLLAAAVWCAGRSIDSDSRRRTWWLIGAGLLLGLSAPVRPIGVFVAPVLIGWAAAATRGTKLRLASCAAVGIGFCLTLGGYLVYQHSATRTWGLTRATGYTLYARAAIFANCSDFTPPAGTSALCQPPQATRKNPDWYMYNTGSPAVRLYGLPPAPGPGQSFKWPPDAKLESFGLDAISHQPVAYLWTSLQGLVKYVDPGFGTGTMLGWSQAEQVAGLHDPGVEAAADGVVAGYYPGQRFVHHGLGGIDQYARAARVEGPLTAVLVVLMLIGLAVSRGRARAAARLFGWTTIVLMVVPVLLLFYEARYATPAYGPLAAAAAIGLDELLVSGRVSGALARARTAAGSARSRSRP